MRHLLVLDTAFQYWDIFCDGQEAKEVGKSTDISVANFRLVSVPPWDLCQVIVIVLRSGTRTWTLFLRRFRDFTPSVFYTEVGMTFHILTIISVCCASCMIPEQGNRSFGKTASPSTLSIFRFVGRTPGRSRRWIVLVAPASGSWIPGTIQTKNG